ncbi:glutathione S-transferase [Xanthomonas vesicatoria ATCC 35937]|uniref:Glutathione S-transferase n=1 Tax=Xanthomonas vesicatoria ATCC 35937 TaxID=925775 RepID=F0BKS3_9XANT|nr:glutathione S-transferase [Xanthomonas vesicatoria]APP75896.1 glutathione S-transferase [Xanthomonas vesicatoria ATCC 35937]EGD06924.1 glutathione S-transferase [Xanthomonas vesicatoria ATCC 35937]KTF32432.1 glutathione S-transferase [Xanthomonas vesicatoria]MCC8598686.1 glutathione S-transferase [Xanthomonas vesicatoria]MCC8607492.1 glutathione S-transferase [Xanthomonas vesicatoria]
MLDIYGKPTSINVRKVLWLCDELALDYRLHAYGSGFAPVDTPDFLALNPNGLVPVIGDGALVLWESNTICRYLAARCRREDLLPTAPAARALVEQWMDWQATELNTAWRYAFMATVRGSAAHTDPHSIAASVSEWNRHMAILDAQLQRAGPYALGADFTLADIVLGLSTQRWFASPIERPPLPAIAVYYALLQTRAGFQRHGCSAP